MFLLFYSSVYHYQLFNRKEMVVKLKKDSYEVMKQVQAE